MKLGKKFLITWAIAAVIIMIAGAVNGGSLPGMLFTAVFLGVFIAFLVFVPVFVISRKKKGKP